MSVKVAQMTKDELKKMIAALIEQKMFELIGSPEDRLTLKKSLKLRLLQQKKDVAHGERGENFKSVIKHLKLS